MHVYGLDIKGSKFNEPFIFCTHTHAATTSGPTGAGGLSTGSIIAIVGLIVGIPGVILAIIGIITAVCKFRKWWLKKRKGGNGGGK